MMQIFSHQSFIPLSAVRIANSGSFLLSTAPHPFQQSAPPPSSACVCPPYSGYLSLILLPGAYPSSFRPPPRPERVFLLAAARPPLVATWPAAAATGATRSMLPPPPHRPVGPASRGAHQRRAEPHRRGRTVSCPRLGPLVRLPAIPQPVQHSAARHCSFLRGETD